jgi:hypothetical protein
LVWNRRTREIQSVAAKIDNDLHLVGRKRVSRILEWMCSRHHAYLGIRPQFFDKPIDQTRIDQGFISLDINYVCETLCFPRHFGYSVRSAAVFRRSQRDLCAPIKRRGSDSHVVGGNDNRIQTFGAAAAFPNMS